MYSRGMLYTTLWGQAGTYDPGGVYGMYIYWMLYTTLSLPIYLQSLEYDVRGSPA